MLVPILLVLQCIILLSNLIASWFLKVVEIVFF